MDNKSQQKDISYQSTTPVGHHGADKNPIDFFSHNTTFVYIYKKTEKLTTALYMVSNLFSDSEPMKWTLRTKSSQLLSFIIGFKDILRSREHEFVHEVRSRILEIVSLLDIASKSGLVSPMNFSILHTEFMNLAHALKDIKKDVEKNTDFSIASQFEEDKHVHKNETTFAQMKSDQGRVHTSPAEVHSIKDKEEMSFKKTNRQQIILTLLKKKDDLTIKDIAEVITDCSEKTIQRELVSLIAQGAIKKTGDRRWSRYTLI
jgi:hypothetical protein